MSKDRKLLRQARLAEKRSKSWALAGADAWGAAEHDKEKAADHERAATASYYSAIREWGVAAREHRDARRTLLYAWAWALTGTLLAMLSLATVPSPLN